MLADWGGVGLALAIRPPEAPPLPLHNLSTKRLSLLNLSSQPPYQTPFSLPKHLFSPTWFSTDSSTKRLSLPYLILLSIPQTSLLTSLLSIYLLVWLFKYSLPVSCSLTTRFFSSVSFRKCLLCCLGHGFAGVVLLRKVEGVLGLLVPGVFAAWKFVCFRSGKFCGSDPEFFPSL